MKGFFSALELPQVKTAVPERGNCSACGLFKGCRTPKMQYAGAGKMKILLVGAYPSEVEDRKGTYGGTEAWQYLVAAMEKIGIDWKQDCWWTNAVKCHPANASDKKRAAAVDHCRPFLLNLIKELQPGVVVLFGKEAVESLVSHLWKPDRMGIERWKGWRIPSQELNAWVCPIENPIDVLQKRDRAVADLLFAEDLRAALSLSGAPYAVVPDYASQVEIIEDTRKAAGFLRSMAARGGEIAFDYETFSLKPDSDDSAIRSCAVSWKGKKTIAFPWIGDAIRATSEMLQNPNCKMIAHNAKFEERWTRAVLGHGVTNWNFDTMLAAHFLDNREDTKSLKFQAFALLGQKDYDSHLTDYLKSDDNTGYGINRVKEIPMGQLLLYNGLDALLEFEVAKVQKRQMRGRGIDV